MISSTLDDLTADVICPACGWAGKAFQAVVELNAITRCPTCNDPVEKIEPDPAIIVPIL